ncbi:MAG: nodulation protein NfeD [Nitrospinae bacterium]|nr:nodulation protein NfeD [Nitrospinota bacterium]
MKVKKDYERRKGLIIFSFIIILVMGYISPALSREEIILLRFEGVINPISAEYIVDEIRRATDGDDKVVIIQLDTPGGLDTSMRIIVKEILNSKIPVVVYVAPSGSRAASAGTFITMAANIAAMSPGTNIGAAHPVNMGGEKMDRTMMKKVENDAVAYIRSIAERMGRNAEWAEKAVRNSVSISEKEAKELGVIDLIAEDIDQLIQDIDGKEVKTETGKTIISTKGVKIRYVDMDLRQRILSVLSNPNIAYILMLIGLIGLYFELSNPGLILPGVVGGISLILAFYAFQTLPINYAGLALILLGLIIFIAEIKVTSYGLLTVGGTISMILGSIMLIDTDVPYLRISWSVILPAVLATALFSVLILSLVVKSHKRKPVSGIDGLIGAEGIATTNLEPEGDIFIHGEIWKGESKDMIKKGDKIIVEKIDGLRLKVKKVV